MKSSCQQKLTRLFAALSFCISLSSFNSVFSQVNKLDEKNLEETMRNPWTPDRSAFLQDWLILGSIPINAMEEIDKDFLAASNGEANAQPAAGQTVTISGIEMKWAPVKSKNIVDLQRFFQGGRTEDAVAYAYTRIDRKEAGRVCLSLGTDDGVKVWLNGRMVHRLLRQRALNLDEDALQVNMNAGENHLLLKIQQSKGGWGFAVRMLVNPNLLNIITGNIEFSLTDINPKKTTLTVFSEGNLDQALLKQAVTMEVYTTGGKTVASKTFNCSEPVVLKYGTWPDGVYEFRFAYKDIRGTKFFKYTTWYKGDILSAARDIVNSAPERSLRTPEAVTHRMLADMILDRLGKNLQNPDSSKLAALHAPLMEFAEIGAHKQIRAGGCIRMAYIDDIDHAPQFCRCYLPLNYDPSKKWPMVVYLHGYYENIPEYYNLWDVNKRHESASDKQNVIFIEPHGRGNTQYLGIGDRDVMKCIEMAKQRFSVDDDKVYLMGSSMGGFGTWNVATRHPELFAAIAPIYGGGDYHVFISKENIERMSAWEIFLNDKSSSTAQMESLLNMPILVSHGDQDQSVNVNLSRYIVRLLQRWNYDVRYIEVPEKGHTDLGLWDQIISWLLQHRRNAALKHVRVRSADLRTASAYWVKVGQRNTPSEFVDVDAEALQGNLIRVDSKNVCELSLTPGKTLIDYDKPIKVVWNGKTTLVKDVQAKPIVLKDENYKPLSLHKTPSTAGPISDFQNTPFIIVVGTISKDTMMKKVIELKVGPMVGDWKAVQKYEPRVKKDVDVTDADMREYSLFLLGGPEENKISKQVFEKTPFAVTSSEILVDGKSFKAKDAVLHAIYPNPYNGERYVAVVAATSAAGFSFFDPRRTDLSQFDFYVTDGKIPVFSAGAKGDKIIIASGFFDRNWKTDSSFMNKGDENLRSKCAYYVVDSNLSMTVLSIAKPSIELLKSYAGTYHVEGGPEVRVFFENDILKAAQGEFSVKLHATAENEFYVQEINLSVAFRKDGATNDYSMIVYQNGQEYTARKVK